MPKYVRCGHYEGDTQCPCVECESLECTGCLELPEDSPYAVDTDMLCAKARQYCNSGRTGIDCEVYVEEKENESDRC